MRCDYHVHSSISADSSTNALEQIKQAEALGLDEICFTEHLEIYFHRGEEWHLDLQDYKQRFAQLISSRVKIKLGIEAGIALAAEHFPELEDELRSMPCDFVLASAHSVDNIDPFDPAFYEGKTLPQAFRDYISAISNGIKQLDPDLYSCVGHIDFPAKGAHTESDSRLFYRYAPDEIDTLFRHIIPLGKCIEVNTSTYRKLGQLKPPGEDWLRRYVQLGGEFVTFGSDAHSPKYIGYRFDDAVEIARRAGVKYYATYDRMKPIFHKL
ncbi:MAG: histidinol-phosphatase HisJ family protein [Syntrophomonadaceae bacterium]|jgi:histidinol-phosphatase (PHP family)